MTTAMQVLDALYVASDGALWTRNSGWNVGMDPCGVNGPREGIQCSSTGVMAARVENLGLHGTIPTQIGLLTDVYYLDINSNPRLSGTVPTQIGQLSTFSYDLYSTQISGVMPTEIGLMRMTRMNWRGARISGVLPTQLGRMTNLQFDLDLPFNPISGTLPTEVGELTLLEELVLSETALSGSVRKMHLPQLKRAALFWATFDLNSDPRRACADRFRRR